MSITSLAFVYREFYKTIRIHVLYVLYGRIRIETQKIALYSPKRGNKNG